MRSLVFNHRLPILLAVSGVLQLSVAHAQAPAPAQNPPTDATGPASKWYLGSQVELTQPMYVVDDKGYALTVIGGQGYAGYQLNPRLAVQTSLGFGRTIAFQHDPASPSAEKQAIQWQVAAAVQLRHGFLRAPERYQVQGIAGLRVSYFNLQRVTEYNTGELARAEARAVNPLLEFGIGQQFRLTPRVDVVGDIMMNITLKTPYNYNILPLAIGGGVALGVNYKL